MIVIEYKSQVTVTIYPYMSNYVHEYILKSSSISTLLSPHTLFLNHPIVGSICTLCSVDVFLYSYLCHKVVISMLYVSLHITVNFTE